MTSDAVRLVNVLTYYKMISVRCVRACVRVRACACVRACVREKRKIEGEGGTGGAGVDRDGGKKPKEREEERKEKSARKTAEEKKTGVQAEADTGEDSCSLLSGS